MALQEAAEAYLISLFKDTNLAAIQAKLPSSPRTWHWRGVSAASVLKPVLDSCTCTCVLFSIIINSAYGMLVVNAQLGPYRKNYFEQTDAIVWVVDLGDRLRMEIVMLNYTLY
ncbi:hypothetical protein M422DRAFT_243694 [Sphaerobolus stellatus SS14]|nr:hypothetical protein M422DRAFT_243694 [Sphaerobolus stellatus SS14]